MKRISNELMVTMLNLISTIYGEMYIKGLINYDKALEYIMRDWEYYPTEATTMMAASGIKPYFFLNSPWVQERAIVAYLGYGLKTLVHDKDWRVRLAVARRGYGLETLVHDEDWRVRRTVAAQGYGHNFLMYDIKKEVRMIIALQGYKPDIYINDWDEDVRCAATHGCFARPIKFEERDFQYFIDMMVEDRKIEIKKYFEDYNNSLDDY